MNQTTKHGFVHAAILLTTLMIHPTHGDAASQNNTLRYSAITYTYKTAGHHQIKADVYRHPSAGLQPAIMYVHGGALIVGSRRDIPPKQLELFINAGFNVVSIDYRLAPETKLPLIIEDLEDAYAWLRMNGPKSLGIDPNRIAVIGMSAGGYLTLTAGFRLNPRPKALVSFYGYGDITGPWLAQPSPFYVQQAKASDKMAVSAVQGSTISETPMESAIRLTFYRYCRQQGRWPEAVSGHNPQEEPDWFYKYEPIRNVTLDYPPTMLLHGEKDTDVPFEQSVLMAKELARNNVDHEFISHPEWAHAFDFASDPTVDAALDRVLAFLKEHI